MSRMAVFTWRNAFKDSKGKLTKRPASAEEYTHVRWVISEIPAGGHGELAFRARVK